MYQTTLRNVYGGMAIGANGERLQFIGNFPAKAGDSVWTDGNIIFGHIPQKASSIPYIPVSKSGIPVLLDDRRGYFSTGGSWVDFPIAQYDWIANNQKVFFGGVQEESYLLPLAVAVSDDNDIFFAEWNNSWCWEKSWITIEGKIESEALVKIYKNQNLLTEISLLPFWNEMYNSVTDCYKNGAQIPDSLRDSNKLGFAEPIGFNLEIQSLNIEKNSNISFVVFGSLLVYLPYTIRKVSVYPHIYKIYYIPVLYSFRYKISGDNKELINYHICGGECVELNLNLDTQLIENDLILQVDDGFCRLDKYGRVSFYDSKLNIIAENIVVDDDFCYVEVDHFQPSSSPTEERLTKQVDYYYYDAKIYYKIFTPDGNINLETGEKLETPLGYRKGYSGQKVPILDGYFIKDSDGYLSPFYFKPILKRMDNGNYLFGTYGGKLYIKTKNTIQEVGSGLKNFILEVLNDISKAKAKG